MSASNSHNNRSKPSRAAKPAARKATAVRSPSPKKRVEKKPVRVEKKPARVAKKRVVKKPASFFAKKKVTKKKRVVSKVAGHYQRKDKRLSSPDAKELEAELDAMEGKRRAEPFDPTLAGADWRKRSPRTAAEIAAHLEHGRRFSSQHRAPPSITMAADHLFQVVLPGLGIVLKDVGTEYTVGEAITRQLTLDQRKAVYLEMFREFGNHRVCSKFTGIARSTVREWRKSDPDFAIALDDAWQDAVDAAELEAWRRAVHGTLEETVTEKQTSEGDHELTVKRTRHYSDSLLQFILRGGKPERYRERHEISGPDGGPMEIAHVEWKVVKPNKGEGEEE